MKKRGVYCLLLLFCVLLYGCGKQENSGKQEEKEKSDSGSRQMGRYVEEQIELPKEFSEGNFMQFILAKNPDGGYDLIGGGYDEKLKSTVFTKFRIYQDGTFGDAEPISWISELNKATQEGENGNIDKFLLGEDGSYYVLYSIYGENYSKTKVFRYDLGKNKLEEIKIADFDKVARENDGYTIYQGFSDMAVLKNKNIVFQDQDTGKLMLYSPEGKKQYVLKIPDGSLGFGVKEDDIFGVNEDKNGIIVINGATGKEKQTIPMDMDQNSVKLCKLQNGDLIATDRKGVHRLKKEGSVWETVIDGSLNSMGMPAYYILGLLSSDDLTKSKQNPSEKEASVSEKPEYFVLYATNESKAQLMKYHFDETITAVPEKELNVYSLREDKLMRQAVSMFQNNHRDVKVNYTVALDGNQEENQDTTEYIHALNTELLNGNGADVLLLDGLPIDSYIEKGILADISSVTTAGKERFLPFILDGYTKDGKVYTLPLRIQIPVAVGEKEAVAAAGSLKSMADYVRAHGDRRLIQLEENESFLKTMIQYSYKEWFDQKEGLKEEVFRDFLDDLMVLKENDIFVKNPDEARRYGAMGYRANAIYVKSGDARLSTETLSDISDLFKTEVLCGEKKRVWDLQNESFYGLGFCAVNAATKEKELSEEFIKELFSDELQKVNFYTGFPVIESALKNWLLESHPEREDAYIGIDGEAENGESVSIEGPYPSKKIQGELYDKIDQLKEPIANDETLSSMVLEAMDGYLDGSKKADDVLRDVKEKVELYMAE